MKSILSYIGFFELQSGTIISADPYINRLVALCEKIPRLNERSILIDNVRPGLYYAYHLLNALDGTVINFILIHSDYSYEDIENETPELLGSVSTTLGNSIVFVDQDDYCRTKYCYYLFDERTLYECDRLMCDIPDMPYNSDMKKRIVRLVNSCLKQGIPAIYGQKITDIVGSSPVWNGFRNYDDSSSQWSMEVMDSLAAAFRNSIIIHGGTASNVTTTNVPVYGYYDKRGNKIGISAILEEIA